MNTTFNTTMIPKNTNKTKIRTTSVKQNGSGAAKMQNMASSNPFSMQLTATPFTYNGAAEFVPNDRIT